MYNIPENPRAHGFKRPFNTLQISSWALFTLNPILYYGFLLPIFDTEIKYFLLKLLFIFIQIALGVSFSVLFVIAGASGIISTWIDPTDESVYQERRVKARNEVFITNLKQYCTVCNTHVKSKTKHCGQCNRCVDDFDHHCKWLNNCVGRRNYRYFIKLIVSLHFLITIKSLTAIYLLIMYERDRYTFTKNISEDKQALYLAMTIVSLVQDPFILIMLTDLIVLHIWLYNKGMTTYEYIVKQRQAKEEQMIKGSAMNVRSSLDINGIEQKKKKNKKVIMNLEQIEEEKIPTSEMQGKTPVERSQEADGKRAKLFFQNDNSVDKEKLSLNEDFLVVDRFKSKSSTQTEYNFTPVTIPCQQAELKFGIRDISSSGNKGNSRFVHNSEDDEQKPSNIASFKTSLNDEMEFNKWKNSSRPSKEVATNSTQLENCFKEQIDGSHANQKVLDTSVGPHNFSITSDKALLAVENSFSLPHSNF